MELNTDQPPLVWPQFDSVQYRRRRSPVSAFFSPPAIILTYTVAFLLISIFIVPPFLSITSQILRPISVKKGWDSINVFLVLFAIICGVFARRNDDGSSPSQPSLDTGDERAITSDSISAGQDGKISSPLSREWYIGSDAADRLKIYESVRGSAPSPVTTAVPLRRSSTSYPDLRAGFFGENVDHHFRFYDDFEIDKYRSPAITKQDVYKRIQNRRELRIEESEPKEIPVDKFEVMAPSPPREPPAPPPPPPSQPSSTEVVQKPRRKHRSVRSRGTPENVRQSDTDSKSTKSKQEPPPAPPPPPPPPPAPFTPPRTALRYEVERKPVRLERRKSNAAKEIKMVLASIYNQRKRKKKLQKGKNKQRNESPVTEPPQYQSMIPPPPPPPPPPRSSQSVFYGLFKKGSKSKKVHSVPAPPPPPPPPPSSRTSKRNTQLERPSPPPPPPAPPTPPRRRSDKPPRPAKPTKFYEENNVNRGQESLSIPIPPPPPPPPFKVPPLKFLVRGDFAKIQSNQSSRCSSPEREVIDLGWGLELTQAADGDEISRNENPTGEGSRNFCPSPDVNTKADSFIARLRDEWRLEKINSVKEKRKLGPDPTV